MNQYEILDYALSYAYQRLSFCASDVKECPRSEKYRAAYDIALKKCLELKALMEKGRDPFFQVEESNSQD